MKRWISARLAGNILLAALGFLLVFHVLVLFEVLPAEIVWGGMIQGGQTNLITLETVALVMTLLFMLIAAPITIILALCAPRLAIEKGAS